MSKTLSVRYSLRTLLIAMTLVALWCGQVSLRARNQKQAADSLETLKGLFDSSLKYDRVAKDSSAPAWLRKLLGEHYFQTAIGAEIHLPAGEEEYRHAMTLLRKVPTVRSLKLSYGMSPIRYDALAAMTDFDHVSELQLLTFSPIAVDEEHLPVPEWTQDMQLLTRLSFENAAESKIPGRWLKMAAVLPAIEELMIRGSPRNGPDDLGLRHLAGSHIKTLDLTRCRATRDELAVFEHLPRLQKIIARPSLETAFGPWSREGDESESMALFNWTGKPNPEKSEIFHAWWKRRQARFEFVGREAYGRLGVPAFFYGDYN
jgi:hypothetical protein